MKDLKRGSAVTRRVEQLVTGASYFREIGVVSHSKAEIGVWQLNLEAAFRPWSKLNGLEFAEMQHREAATQRDQGFRALMRAYQDFALRTLDEAARHGVSIDPFNVALNVAAIRRFRAGWLAYDAGYYFDAASSLRSVLEITMYLAAVLKGYFPFDELLRPDADVNLSSIDARQVRKLREKKSRELNSAIKRIVYGEASGLSESTRKDIELHFALLHMHVHRGESHVVHDVLELLETKTIPKMVLEHDRRKASIYANAAVLAGWTHTRGLPFLSRPDLFSQEWKDKYSLLNRSFRFYFDSPDCPMNSAFLELIDTSFSFNGGSLA